jgi:hypothetical protein
MAAAPVVPGFDVLEDRQPGGGAGAPADAPPAGARDAPALLHPTAAPIAPDGPDAG